MRDFDALVHVLRSLEGLQLPIVAVLVELLSLSPLLPCAYRQEIVKTPDA